MIGLLDMFGFECFDTNSLEQLCINFANERLQSHFTKTTFEQASREAAAEGVPLRAADFSALDPTPTLQLLAGKPAGVLLLIAEEGFVPRGTDASLHVKLKTAHSSHPRFECASKERSKFNIVHYAGPVTYDTAGLLEKARDPMPEDAAVLLAASTNPFIASLFGGGRASVGASQGKTRLRSGLLPAFDAQLHDLAAVLEAAESRFVRCIKPNTHQIPGLWDDTVVRKQLRSSAVIAAVDAIAAGYPDRLLHAKVVARCARLVRAVPRAHMWAGLSQRRAHGHARSGHGRAPGSQPAHAHALSRSRVTPLRRNAPTRASAGRR
jgi:myosin heavy subunit